MNLLGHYVCARHLTPPEQLGSVLGDLVPLYRRKVRLLPLTRAWERGAESDPRMTGLLKGVRHHFWVDSRFHRDPLFTDTAARVGEALRRAGGGPGLKRFFPAHVLTEMFFDHLLMTGEPELLEEFYGLFDERAEALAARFVIRHPQADEESFRRFVGLFLEERFLDAYRSYEGIVRRMQQMLPRFRQRALEPAEAEAAVAELEAGKEATYGRLLQFVTSMRHADRARIEPAAETWPVGGGARDGPGTRRPANEP